MKFAISCNKKEPWKKGVYDFFFPCRYNFDASDVKSLRRGGSVLRVFFLLNLKTTRSAKVVFLCDFFLHCYQFDRYKKWKNSEVTILKKIWAACSQNTYVFKSKITFVHSLRNVKKYYSWRIPPNALHKMYKMSQKLMSKGIKICTEYSSYILYRLSENDLRKLQNDRGVLKAFIASEMVTEVEIIEILCIKLREK